MELIPVVIVPEFIVVVVYHKVMPVGESFPIIFLGQPIGTGMDLFQRQRARLVGVVNVVTVVVQVLDDIPVKQQSVKGDVLVGQQRFTGQLQRRKHGVRLSHAADLVPIEDAVRGKVKIKFHLTEVVASLKEKNQQYAALTEQRTNAQADNPIESAKKIRLRMDEEYDEMTTYAFAQSVVKPTATTATFINRLNTLIDETNALYNQRIAQARAAAAKKQADSESPSEI